MCLTEEAYTTQICPKIDCVADCMEDAPRHSEMDPRDAAQEDLSSVRGRRTGFPSSMRLRVSTLVGTGGRLLIFRLALRLSSPGPSPARGHAWCCQETAVTAARPGHYGVKLKSGQWESSQRGEQCVTEIILTYKDEYGMELRNQLRWCTGTELTL